VVSRPDAVAPRRSRLRADRAVGEQGLLLQRLLDRRRPRVGAVAVDQQPGDAVAHGGAQAADVGGDDRRPAGLRLQGDQAEALVVAGDGDEVGRPVPVAQALGVPGAAGGLEAHPAGDAEVVREGGEPVGLRAARPAEDGDDSGRARSAGGGGVQVLLSRPRRRRGAGTSGALSGCRRPTNSSRTASGGTPDAGLDRGASRPEVLEVDAGGDGDHALDVGVVSSTSWRASTAVFGTEPVCGVDTCCSPTTRARGSGRSPVGQARGS
jgi:hypothetical protein